MPEGYPSVFRSLTPFQTNLNPVLEKKNGLKPVSFSGHTLLFRFSKGFLFTLVMDTSVKNLNQTKWQKRNNKVQHNGSLSKSQHIFDVFRKFTSCFDRLTSKLWATHCYHLKTLHFLAV